MGVTIEFDDLPDKNSSPPTLLTANNASVNSFATALIGIPNTLPQQTDLAIPVEALAAAALHGDGLAMSFPRCAQERALGRMPLPKPSPC